MFQREPVLFRCPFPLVAVLLLLTGAGAARGQDDEVPVPGGPGAVRRFSALEPSRPKALFFLDLHEVLLSGGDPKASWNHIERRKALVGFVEDLAEWRREFGNPAGFSIASKEEWKRARRALEWLGFKVKGEARSFTADRRDDERSVRRQGFLDALGTPLTSFQSKLRAGERVTIASADETAPLPFGLAAWRETVNAPGLSAAEAFLFFVKNVQASRMLVALQALDPDTRDGLRLFRDEKGRSLGWRVLYEKGLNTFTRFPEALVLRDGHFALPGGKEAEPIWKDIFGVSPADRPAFLSALFETDSGKAAYVVAVLQQLPERIARELLLGRTGGGEKAVKRFQRLYRAIESSGESFELVHRDPYDFGHLARFLKLSDEGDLLLPAAGLDGSGFPRNEGELAQMLSGASRSQAAPEETLRLLLRREAAGAAVRLPAQRRFLFVSNLLYGRPALGDPGLTLLLFRGVDRFLPAYAVLEDLPLDARLARRYLFTLDRLYRRGSSRDTEVAAGLFEGGVELLAQLFRAGALDSQVILDLFSSFLDLPLFARDETTPARGERDLFGWLSGRLLSSLRAAQRRMIEARVAEPGPELTPVDTPGESPSSDDLLTRALAGPPAVALFEWHGGRYRFDPTTDDAGRRREFREKQRLTWLADLETIHNKREALAAAAAEGDLAAVKAATSELAGELKLPSAKTGKEEAEEDERVRREIQRAREAAADLLKIATPRGLSSVEGPIANLDAVIAERDLEAFLGHVYAASAGDPNDLYYQDPGFVRRHSFRGFAAGPGGAAIPFARTELSAERAGGGSRITGSLFGLADALGLLHADQITYKPGAFISSEEIRSGLVGPVRRMSAARLDDDALRFVAASCRATEEFAAATASLGESERERLWSDLARDLVPRSRLGLLSVVATGASSESLSGFLSPSDLYRIGRRLALGEAPAGVPALPSAARAREAFEHLGKRLGEAGAAERLAEFGPRAVSYAGRFRLTDMDMPPYERTADYRTPQIFSDRLYDLKIAVARRVSQAGLPAAVLPLVLPGALDEMMATLKMAFVYDWASIVRAAQAFGPADVDRFLDEALKEGRLVRDQSADALEASE